MYEVLDRFVLEMTNFRKKSLRVQFLQAFLYPLSPPYIQRRIGEYL